MLDARFRKAFGLGVATAALLACSLANGSSKTSERRLVLDAPSGAVPADMFDLNIIGLSHWSKWPRERFGGWRTFHFTWPYVEPTKGNWNFDQSDYEASSANAHGVQLLPVLGGVPTWADSPSDPARLRPDVARRARFFSMPSTPADFVGYVRTVATRYKGSVHEYELWNEPATIPRFAANFQSAVGLDRVAYETLKRVDPTITVVCSSFSTGSPVPERTWDQFEAFVKAGGLKYCDVVGYHFYFDPPRAQTEPGPPETIIESVERLNSILAKYDVKKPIWITEMGWPTLNDDKNPDPVPAGMGRPLSPSESAAWLARSYMLGWTLGLQRIYWFAWRHGYFGLTEYNGDPKAPEVAFETIQNWMVGSVVQTCVRDSDGLWDCTLRRPSGVVDHVLWVEHGRQSFSVPKTWHASWVSKLNNSSAKLDDSTVTVDESPELIAPTAQ